jgi:catechol 2,3-dioxygenase-like lactoylglutathione lyase family enzyme
MSRSVVFYRSLGFEALYGGPDAGFSSFNVGEGYLNLMAVTLPVTGGWCRVVFYVSNVDDFHAMAIHAGHRPEAPPSDAEWGERYFHLDDPDGHRLSFARPL